MPNSPASPCTFPGCGQPGVERGRCVKHKRGTTTQRGYGANHERIRAALEYKVRRGDVTCWRCGELILAGEAWDLGHDMNRTKYKGPEHARCNRSAGSISRHSS